MFVTLYSIAVDDASNCHHNVDNSQCMTPSSCYLPLPHQPHSQYHQQKK